MKIRKEKQQNLWKKSYITISRANFFLLHIKIILFLRRRIGTRRSRVTETMQPFN